ncbi:hypothetical protein AB21_4891 [Escherichia coli 4-203-08_S1_C1]|nr:hypothetical protein ECFDA506_0304 [Escherichia coli FDA506]EKK80571.1 hypothetical protein EC100821_5058 [Escherichia coli 10.0821]KDU58751.1 hypothetical protein AB21_4891 [Escherichia coli 4-203-08_S1_C1]KDZ77112.1 hypothetical protein AD14_0432 [Escherichia coli 3-073-06_S4_C2]KEK90503.1 hypothetical protein AB49_4823 [Escherichia coli 4-203-08_S1_C2]KEK91790.1 hypothetical protein AB78_4787 [Escherichia coli 4-203-08_S1_C3]
MLFTSCLYSLSVPVFSEIIIYFNFIHHELYLLNNDCLPDMF